MGDNDAIIIARLATLLKALRDGPLHRPALLARLGSAYPADDSGRRMVDRDVTRLNALGIVIERSRTRPPRYTLRGGAPHFNDDELVALALVRDTFGAHHPQGATIQALLARLTAQLAGEALRRYRRQPALRAPVEPAIDYAPFAPLIAALEAAIAAGQRLTFRYHAPHRAHPLLHRLVEPHAIEFFERHFYLVAYTPLSGQVLDFRIDRIAHDASFQPLDPMPPHLAHSRAPIRFRYRLAAAVARGGVSQRFAQQHVAETLPNGDVIVEAEGRSDFFVIQTLLRYRGNAELLEPAWLRAKMAAEVRRLGQLYGLVE